MNSIIPFLSGMVFGAAAASFLILVFLLGGRNDNENKNDNNF